MHTTEEITITRKVVMCDWCGIKLREVDVREGHDVALMSVRLGWESCMVSGHFELHICTTCKSKPERKADFDRIRNGER